MKNRYSIVVLTGRNLLLARQLFPPQPQTQPTTHARHTIRYRWLFLLLAVLALSAIAAQAQSGSLPPPPVGKEYAIDWQTYSGLTQNICYAAANGYSFLSIATIDLPISKDKCSLIPTSSFPFPPPPAGPPYYFKNRTDCENQQENYFTNTTDDNAFYLSAKGIFTKIEAGTITCDPQWTQNPDLASWFAIPYPIP